MPRRIVRGIIFFRDAVSDGVVASDPFLSAARLAHVHAGDTLQFESFAFPLAPTRQVTSQCMVPTALPPQVVIGKRANQVHASQLKAFSHRHPWRRR